MNRVILILLEFTYLEKDKLSITGFSSQISTNICQIYLFVLFTMLKNSSGWLLTKQCFLLPLLLLFLVLVLPLFLKNKRITILESHKPTFQNMADGFIGNGCHFAQLR